MRDSLKDRGAFAIPPPGARQRAARLLSTPQLVKAPAWIGAVFVLCVAALVLVLVGETVALPGVTLGSYALIIVLLATWTLPALLSSCIAAVAAAVLVGAVLEGDVDALTGVFQLTATAIIVVVSRLTVGALHRSELRRSELHRQLLDSESRRADEAAAQLAEQDHLAVDLREALSAVGEQASELRRLNTRLIDFTADAAHELRAPLAIMRTVADRALARPREAAEYRESLTTLQHEVVRLSRTTDTLLLLARADDGQLVAHPGTVEVADFVAELAARWQAMVESRGLTLYLDLPDEGIIHGDSLLLARLFDNLLDNACRHSEPGGRIVLAAHPVGAGWVLSVSNTGPGIPAELRGELFERFRRGDPARSRESGGAGLGLALCQAIAGLHGGSVRLEGADAGVTRFAVELP